jgi:glycosyltransferase involved in cell wall biosynthesis
MNDGLVLHVASPPGGGVDRYVRDLARTSTLRHAFWHATERADAVEMPCGGRTWPLASEALAAQRDALGRWLRAQAVGLVHAHSMTRPARRRAFELAAALGVPIVATLHDVLFLDPEGFGADGTLVPQPAWLAEVGDFLRACAAVVAPSQYIADLAHRHIAGLEVHVVPNGIDEPREQAPREPRAAFASRAPGQVVAVIGAIGPHKGSAVVNALDASLARSGITVVVVGYLDAQVHAGWRGDHVFVHGPFAEDETAAWLDAYGARAVLFPNRAPESFSYALSEAWAARRPVVVPDEGALGERVAAHGGGWRLPPRSDAGVFADLLRSLFTSARADEFARVQSAIAPTDRARIPRMADMTRSLDALYRRFGLDPGPVADPSAAPAQALLAANLDASLFRVELARLADERVQLEDGLRAERERAEAYEREARAWISKIELDLGGVQAELTAENEQRRACEESRELLRREVSRLETALLRLPAIVRHYLLKPKRDGRA